MKSFEDMSPVLEKFFDLKKKDSMNSGGGIKRSIPFTEVASQMKFVTWLGLLRPIFQGSLLI